jgi:hypothetical protein
MKPDPRTPPGDDETDCLLGRHYRETSPEFEARWVALKRDLRRQPAVRARWRPFAPWTGWLGVMGAAAAVALAVHFFRPASPSGRVPSPQLAELFAMDAVLHKAAPLLDEDNRSALLHLPVLAGQTPN